MASLKLSNVYDSRFRSELSLEGNARNLQARERLANTVDELRRNKGWSVILRGHDLRLRDAPRDPVKATTHPRDCISKLRAAKPKSKRQPSFRSAPVAITRFSIQRFLLCVWLNSRSNTVCHPSL